MKRQIKRTVAALSAAALAVGTVPSAYASGGVTTSPTPQAKSEAALYWATVIQDGWANWADAPSVPTIVDDELVYVSNTSLCAIDKETGEVLEKKGTLAATVNSYALTAPLYVDGMILVAEQGGIIQAFDAETFESLWVYTDELGGQPNSELVYSDGYVYTGFWSSETGDASFVCVPVEDTDTTQTSEAQKASWTYTVAGGFYWAGAYCTDDYVIVGTDNGIGDSSSAGSSILVFDKDKSIEASSAALIDKNQDVAGDLRSAVNYDETTGYYYVTSKAGTLYRFKVSEDGSVSDVSSLDLGGATTSTPVIANGRLYVGVCGTSAYSAYSGHHISVIDTASFKEAYQLQTDGYPQSSALVCDDDGENYVYFTVNYSPDKIYVFHDNASMTEPESTETVTTNSGDVEACPVLFTTTGSHANYCISSLITDEDGTLYFKNDSGCLFALGSRYESISVEGSEIYCEGDVITADDLTVTATLANGLTKDVTSRAELNLDDSELTVGEYELSVSFDGMLYGDTEDEIGYEYDPLYCEYEYVVLAAADYESVTECIALIDDIDTDITFTSNKAILAARDAYDALSDELKAYVTNYEVLTAAETAFDELTIEQVVLSADYTATTDSITISWSKVQDATGYRISRYDSATGTYVTLADVDADTLAYTDSDGLDADAEYTYKVQAFVTANDLTYWGDESESFTAKTLANSEDSSSDLDSSEASSSDSTATSDAASEDSSSSSSSSDTSSEDISSDDTSEDSEESESAASSSASSSESSSTDDDASPNTGTAAGAATLVLVAGTVLTIRRKK